MKQENKRDSIKPESIYMWYNVDKTVKIIEWQINLISKPTDLYDPQYCSKKMKIVHSNLLILLENVSNEKPYEFVYEFKFHCTSVNDQ